MAKYSRSVAHHEGVARRDQLPARRTVPQHLLLPVRPPLHRRPRAHPFRDRATLASSPPSSWSTSSAGTARSAPRATRTSAPPAGSHRTSAKKHRPSPTPSRHMFQAYDDIGKKMLEALKAAIPQPETMKPEAYERTLKARAFDVARYLLPLATNTSLGQIVNARTLETQVSRLLTSEFAEVREIAEKLRIAATEPAWNVQHAAAQVLCEEISSVDSICGKRAIEALLRPVKTAPTLVKYAAENAYQSSSRKELTSAAAELMHDQPIDPAPVVDLLDDAEPLEVELATSLLYPHCHYSYRQLRSNVAALSALAPHRADRTRHEASRTPRRAPEGLQRWSQLALRHPDGHRRFPRYASTSSLRAAASALHRCSRLRGADLPRPTDAGRSWAWKDFTPMR